MEFLLLYWVVGVGEFILQVSVGGECFGSWFAVVGDGDF